MNALLTLLLLATVPQETAAPEAEAPDAQEEAAPEAEPETKLEATTTGYLDTRFTGSHVSSAGLVPTTGVPALANLSEGNMQVKLRYGPGLSAGADLSLYWQWAGLFRGVDTRGEEVVLSEQDVPLYRPSAVVSELFAAWEAAPHLHLTLGKKRVVWGSGMAFNPTDLLNPPKDPTDPAGQRAGAWLARVEMPFERFTVSLVGAAKVLRQYAGLPTSLLVYPDYPTSEAVQNPALDDRDNEAHWAAAARLYALVADTDVTLTYHFTHLYNDPFREKSRVGLSLSRVFGATEVHLEALAQTGSSRLYAAPACTTSTEALLGCTVSGTPPLARTHVDDRGVRAKVLVGARYLFEDNAMLSAEYYFNGEGYSAREFADYVGLLGQGRQLLAQLTPEQAEALTARLSPTGAAADPGSPQKFTFEPLRRHYLLLQYSKPQVADDFVLGASAVVNLGDLSGQLIPQVSWSAREWLTLSASAFIPLPGVKSLAAEVAGQRITEASLSASDWRALLSARLFF
ncbi:hypothetical protein [Vitiosangium sp. GDMCC 1.1324]|uniref:hypothetical protein n=1 Tax=Vitiosangium sp. (strain GDMCC 1.1324) TaxID=2138576 RepID=UPI000D356831|nr:hypothetical protein [Vitiosangium sp. GDMCC 1.1324]PTL82711.1 hypothetical protein DAT35_18215 [Vitiosangium sp. GDMCC 1.1324]